MKTLYFLILDVILSLIILFTPTFIFAAQVDQLVYEKEPTCSDFTKNLR